MLQRLAVLSLITFFTVTSLSFTQNRLDPRPLDPEIDPDIDMFIESWENSRPYNTHGMLIERAVLSKCDGDPLKPSRKGAVLKYVNRFSRALLDAGCTTTPTTLKDEQEIFYIISGKGVIKTKSKTAELCNGILVLVPAELEFTIINTGDEPLTMYLICEPIPEGFRPNSEILVRDEKTITYRDDGYLSAHWCHNGKNIFGIKDGLGTLSAVNIGTMNAMTIGHPHSHGEGIEEVWTLLEGKNLELLGKEIRWIYPGAAFLIPPTGFTPHSHINPTKKLVKFLLFARWGDHEVRK